MIVHKNNAEHYRWGNMCDGWHLVKDANLSVIYENMPPQTEEVRHYHTKSRQFFFVLDGVATMEVDGKIYEIRAREGIEVAPNVPHQMMNRSEETIEFLVVSQPRSHGDRIEAEIMVE
ncbi:MULTISPECIES: cupin domain-containing protein [unclassified Paenibacillus]|uniref:cupin domain-containing protein n=1 Tax=unclassified Paenibacillus TaxID=185978 RepID=UPI001C0FEE2C|nr:MULTISPECIES: cupin domain-containing protein [unclassified Paenibacillus]MBU5443222.1 cupin domain-containing protein [Paenibacillus sp. MSJ-34]CAH0121378.1 hypothetical protein PAE9249_03906 [Paenibacillus sp. CECT 9249]